MKPIDRCLAVISFAWAVAANAATFDFTETFAGTFQTTSSPFSYSEFQTLTPGGSNLPAALASDSYGSVASDPTTLTFSGGNANGTYFGIGHTDSYVQRGSSNIWDVVVTFSFTSGTGIFAGISGGGTTTGFDTYLTNTSGTNFRQLQGTYTVPVPEPSSYAMMLAGLLAVGMLGRRKRK